MFPQAYINYLVHFHGDRDYFECHEELEEYWKEDDRDHRKDYWVAFIQVAVSLYHQRRNNFKGSLRMMNNARTILQNEKENVTKLGLHFEKLLSILDQRIAAIELEQPYASISLPITNQTLLTLCQKECEKRGLIWNSASNLNDEYLVHKHKLRDRADVIQERLKQKELKKNRTQ
ncbi:DUF309 domain-containing protein [Bacillus pinisoli]|uniref:DUF309 domain-containing protein n=1 Tax=Bacillus pinisoli TaxID=2901866 RepID=UPI001FF6F3C2|nr:DUF309 domain-containing protein [Bacillus pinisoli]